MPSNKDLVTLTIRLRREQVTQLDLLRIALAEKMGTEMTKSDLLEKIIDEFFEK